ncbi:hypothetical protein Br6_04885 [Rhodococcus sp. Br-6]|nr:hypothetical protein Br6_04885 [Rhodococcus sp. Br-6]
MPETTTKVLPVLQAAETIADLAEAAKLRAHAAPAWEIEEPAEANAVRALYAAGPLAEYAKSVGDTGEELQIVLYDLLADLHHLADATGVDWDSANETAHARYIEEVRGEL